MTDDNVETFDPRKRNWRGRATPSPELPAPPPSAQSEEPPEPGSDAPFELWLARHPRNDMRNAARLIARHGHNLVWVRTAGWMAWDKGRWSLEDGAKCAELAAQETAAAMVHEARQLELAGPLRGEGDPAFAKRIEKAWQWATGSGNSRRLAAMRLEAAPCLERSYGEMDADPWLFNMANCTLELGARQPDGTVEVRPRPHTRADLITRISPIAYDREASEAPRWSDFLNFFLPDREVQAFLQRWFGYCLTGSITEQCVLLLHGEGNNGKSTMVDLMAWLLGNYAMSLPINSLTVNVRKSGSEASPDLARLPSARLVRAAEPNRDAVLDESLIKQLTGGEPLVARNLNMGFFEYSPTFKLVISFNRRPTIRGNDDGIWRRLCIVPFPVQIREQDCDKQFLDKLKAEGPAIFNWVLDGYRLWRDQGLGYPEAIKKATASYRMDSDPIGPFITSGCVISGSDDDRAPASELWAAYQAWCTRNAAAPVSQTTFGRRLTERKGVRKETVGTVQYFGIKIVDRSLLNAPSEEPAR